MFIYIFYGQLALAIIGFLPFPVKVAKIDEKSLLCFCGFFLLLHTGETMKFCDVHNTYISSSSV